MTFGKKQNNKDNKCLENYFQDILTIQLYGAHTLIIKLKKKKEYAKLRKWAVHTKCSG